MSRSESHSHKHRKGGNPDTCLNGHACQPQSSWEKSGQKEVKSGQRGTILTAVRQGTAKDGVWQQASRGATGGAVHDAIFTVAAEENHSPALQEQLYLPSPFPRLPLTHWASSPITHLKHSLLRPPMPTTSLTPVELFSVLFVLDPLQHYSSLLATPFF